jgi:outer membrane receptor protein involved in Fe transport
MTISTAGREHLSSLSRRLLLSAALASGWIACAAHAQAPGGPAAGADAGPSELVVTGSHIQGAPVAAPIVEVSRQDLERGGFTTVAQALASLPMSFGGGINIESSAAQGSAVNGKDFSGLNDGGGSTANLRGLGATATLVLLDGARLPPKGDGIGVDISLIPLSAVDHIEVLTDGASAVYGSDAVAGVVNIITKRDASGFRTSVRYDAIGSGTPDYSATQSLGANWSGGNLFVNYQHDDRGAISSRFRAATAGEPLPTYLYPKQTQDSGYLSLRQAIGGGWSAFAQGYYAGRTQGAFVDNAPPGAASELVNSHAAVDGGAVVFGLRSAPASTLHVEVFGTVGHSATASALDATAGEIASGALSSQRSLETSDTASGEGRISATAFQLPSGAVKIAAGASYRRETAAFDRFPGTFHFQREVEAAYGEASIPLAGDDVKLTALKNAVLSVAGRYEHYSDFGDTVNPRVGVTLHPTDELALKGSYSTSFRAPSSYEETTVGTTAIFYNSQDPQSPTGTSGSIYRVGDNAGLRPETARNFTVSLDYQPGAAPGLKLSADYFNIDFKNRIVAPDPQDEGLFNLAAPTVQGYVTRSPSASQIDGVLASSTVVNFTGIPNFSTIDPNAVRAIVDARFQNAAATRTSGLDLAGTYRWTDVLGSWQASLGATYLLQFDQQAGPQLPMLALVNTIYEPLRFKARAGLAWDRGPWSAAAFVNFANAYTDNRNPPLAPSVGAWTTLDLHLAYRLQDGLGIGPLRDTSIRLNVANLAASPPPRVAANAFGFAYDAANSSAIGRVVGVELVKSW